MDLACDGCGKEFTPARSDAQYCSGACRTRAYRDRHGRRGAPRKRRPLPEAFDAVLWDLTKRSESLARLAEDDRLPRNREKLSYRSYHELGRIIERLEQAREAVGDPSHFSEK